MAMSTVFGDDSYVDDNVVQGAAGNLEASRLREPGYVIPDGSSKFM